MVGVGIPGIGKFGRRVARQIVTQTPLGQMQMVFHVANLKGRPLSAVSVFDITADKFEYLVETIVIQEGRG